MAQATTIPFTEGEVMTALCLWEAWLDFEATTGEDNAPLRLRMGEHRDGHGSFTLRAAVARMTRDCDAAWEAHGALTGEHMCFDFEFCPNFIRASLDNGQLENAIRAEYGEAPIEQAA